MEKRRKHTAQSKTKSGFGGHQALGYKVLDEIYYGKLSIEVVA